MSGLSEADRESLTYALGPWSNCDVDALAPAVEAIVTRAVNEALTEAADAIFEYACGWSREPLARTAAKGAAAIVRARTN